MRDDFTNSTKMKLALRAGAVCSNPLCRRSTFGAKQGKDGYHNIGVAAHITAAAPGGPRYDATLTRDQRRHTDNGIWLCQTHGDLVDGDDKAFTIKMLQEWKHDAERRSRESLLGLGPAGSGPPPNAAADALENQLGAAGGADIGAVVSRMLPAATGDITALKRMPGWPTHPVELNLRLREGENTRAFNVSGLAAAVEAFNEFSVVAPPGTGKTTTLIQVVDAIHAIGRAVALFIPLGEWSSQDRDFLASVLSRPAFRDGTESNLQQLAEHGRLVLMLDGWNELDADGRKRATAQLRILQRDYPRLCVVISTRREALDLPLGGQAVDIDLLSDEQQLEIARAIRGDEGAALVDAAWRTKGVRELVTIPLYLTALLASTPGDRLPTTKEEILRLFAKQHEGAAEKAGALREALFGFHPQMLTAIAVEATQTANTAISDTRARAVVRAVEDRLTAEGQITTAPQPTVVLDVLVRQHTLVRSGVGVLSFQHQQFQEWYASFEVEQVMRAATAGDVDAAWRLRVEFLDQRVWEEAVLFACERLSREGNNGAHAVAQAIVSALSVDPLLAAEMIYRSADAVWNAVSATVVPFVQRWHRPGQIDRAVSFMVTSGRAEFAATIWPLVESQDQQIYLSFMRAARRFRPSVLGPDAAKRLAAIPEKSRGHVLGELAFRSGIDGMDLATDTAKADPAPEVQFQVIQSLLFRRGDRHVNELLKTAPDDVWALLSKRSHGEEITAPGAADRLQAARAKIKSETTAPAAAIGLLLDDEPTPDVAKGIEDAIASKEFPVRNDHGRSTLYLAFERYPKPVAGGLLRRLEAGLELPYSADDYLSNVTRDYGPIAALTLDAKAPEAAGISAARVAGPNTARALMDAVAAAAERLAAAPQNARQGPGNELQLWEDRLAVTPEASFVAALLTRAPETSATVIGAIASVVSRHGSRDRDEVPLALADQAARVVELMRGWAESLIADRKAARYHLSSLAMAIGRLARPELLEPLRKLRDEDARRRREAQAQTHAAGAQASIDLRSDSSTGYNLQYRDAFARMGEAAAQLMIGYLADDDFGFDAACVLKAIYDRVHGVERPGLFKSWPHLPDVPARRGERGGGPVEGDTAYSDAIFAEVERLIAPGSSEKQQDLAIMIARMAIAMPYRDKEGLIERLFALPRPVRTKRELVASLVMAGETFSADLALTAISDWIEDSKKNRWRFDQGMWEVTGWLELLPFSDRPETVLDGVRQVMDALPHPQSMERVVTSAGAAPEVSEDHLQELFRHYPHLASQHEWAQTFLKRGTVEAVKVVLALVKDQRLGSGPGHVDIWWLSRQIASFAKSDAALLTDILRMYDEAASGPVHRLLEGVLQETGGAPGMLALVKCYARAGKGFDGSMHQALRHTAVEEHPIPGSNAYNLHPVSVATLRKELFAMMHGADSRVATIAEACLSNIDCLRDSMMGAVESEPRHPDIASGKPWPREAGNVEPSGDTPAAE